MSAQVLATTPILASLDFDETAAFYRHLGFDTMGRWEGEYLILKREGVMLHFWLCNDRSIPKNTACFLYVRDAAALYAEFAAEDLKDLRAPALTNYQMLEFALIDPHGNLLRIGQLLPS